MIDRYSTCRMDCQRFDSCPTARETNPIDCNDVFPYEEDEEYEEMPDEYETIMDRDQYLNDNR